MIRQASPDELPLCLGLRRVVFIEEQGVSLEEEVDGLDPKAVHLLAFQGDRPVGTARLLAKGATGKIGRVCVLADLRGQGIGAGLIRASLDHWRGTPGIMRAELGAQIHAIGFYQALGFSAYGPQYLDAGILHRDMELVF